MSAKDLVVPIYLDTNSLLDLIATLEGGYSTVELKSVDSFSNSALANDAKIAGGASVGFTSIFSLFRLSSEQSNEKSERTQLERYHTYGSLLNRLRLELLKREWLIQPRLSCEWNNLTSGEYIEFSGKFGANPFDESINTSLAFLDLWKVMEPLRDLSATSSSAETTATPRQSGKNRQQRNARPVSDTDKRLNAMHDFLSRLSNATDDDQSNIFVVDIADVGYRAVTRLFPSFLRDRLGVELHGGEFRMLGKVGKLVGSNESIDLVRGTPLAGMNNDAINALIDAFAALGESWNLPEVTREVAGPAVVVVPIAIYV